MFRTFNKKQTKFFFSMKRFYSLIFKTLQRNPIILTFLHLLTFWILGGFSRPIDNKSFRETDSRVALWWFWLSTCPWLPFDVNSVEIMWTDRRTRRTTTQLKLSIFFIKKFLVQATILSCFQTRGCKWSDENFLVPNHLSLKISGILLLDSFTSPSSTLPTPNIPATLLSLKFVEVPRVSWVISSVEGSCQVSSFYKNH